VHHLKERERKREGKIDGRMKIERERGREERGERKEVGEKRKRERVRDYICFLDVFLKITRKKSNKNARVWLNGRND
jgi:hypothetical protein